MTWKMIIGDYGQKIAAEFLAKRGYQILAQKYFTREGEIDLVGQKDGQLIFFEVKTRLSDKYGLPEEAIDAKKKEKMSEAALKYLVEKQIEHDNYRFDCVAIEIDKGNKIARIRHHKGI
ncbi:MAG: YraN family protein [Candidatus Parcubacteria bacterium]|nr:YraN family protein [Candidatus Parcubacteria bacterium]